MKTYTFDLVDWKKGFLPTDFFLGPNHGLIHVSIQAPLMPDRTFQVIGRGRLSVSRWTKRHPSVDLLKSGYPDHLSGRVPYFSSWFICSSLLRPFSWIWASAIITGSCPGRLPWAVHRYSSHLQSVLYALSSMFSSITVQSPASLAFIVLPHCWEDRLQIYISTQMCYS